MIIAYAILLIMPLVIIYLNINEKKRLPTNDSILIVGHWYEVSGLFPSPVHLIYAGVAKGNKYHFEFPINSDFRDIFVKSELFDNCKFRLLKPEDI